MLRRSSSSASKMRSRRRSETPTSSSAQTGGVVDAMTPTKGSPLKGVEADVRASPRKSFLEAPLPPSSSLASSSSSSARGSDVDTDTDSLDAFELMDHTTKGSAGALQLDLRYVCDVWVACLRVHTCAYDVRP
jgi:hypothetical protein